MENNKNDSLDSHKEVLKGSGIVLVGMAFTFVFGYLFKMITARHYGPSDYGLIGIGVTVMGMVSNLSMLGMNVGISRYIPYYQQKNDEGKLKGGMIFGAKLITISSVISCLLIYIFARQIAVSIFKNNNLVSIIKLFAITIPVLCVLNYMIGIFRGIRRMEYIAICQDIVGPLLKLAIVGVLIIFGLTVNFVPFAYLLSTIIIVIIAGYFFKNAPLYSKLRTISQNPASKELLSFSLPLTLSTMFQLFRKRFDLLLIGYFLSEQDVGLYYAAAPIAMLLTRFLFSINRIIMPVASDLYGGERFSDLTALFKNTAKWSLTATLPFFALMFGFPEIIMTSLFGQKFADAAVLLRILAVGFFINSISGSFGEYFQSVGKSKYVMWISITGTITNISLMVFLIPRYGAMGAALSMTVSLIIMIVIGLFLLAKYKQISPFSRNYIKTLIAGLFVFLPIFLTFRLFMVSPSIYTVSLGWVFAIMIYFLILYVCKAFSREDKIMIRFFKDKLKASIQR